MRRTAKVIGSVFIAALAIFGLSWFLMVDSVVESHHAFDLPALCAPGSSLEWTTGVPPGYEIEALDVGCIDESRRRHGISLRLVEGNPVSLSHFVHGVVDGTAVIWGPTSNVQMISQTSNGKPSGTTLQLDSEGRPKIMISIDSESGRASQWTWHPGGGQRSHFYTTVDSESGLPTAKLVGAYSFRDAEGDVLVQGQYEDGRKIGLWRCRPESDDKFTTATFPGGANDRTLIDCLNRVDKENSDRRPPSQVAASATPH